MIGTVLSNRYRIEAKLGSGGMSTVYLAHDQTLERPVAVKLMHREISDQPDQIERFRHEARAVAKLSHPNLVAVIDAGEDGGHPYIVLEYVQGETLKDRIERLGGLPLDEATAYAIEIGRGLAAAHARNLVHRDVKPQNVVIDSDGRAKVTDFGIARNLDGAGLTATGRVLGTTDYVSPEQALGQPVDARSDIYSLGIVLYEMLTGDVPFHAETQVGIAMKHVNEALPDVQRRRPDVSAALAAALERATAKDPSRRYPDMRELRAELEAALVVVVARAGASSGEATTVLGSVGARRGPLLTRRRASWAGALVVLAVIAGVIVLAALIGGEGPSRESVEGAAPISLTAAKDFDPPSLGGDGGEIGSEVHYAIDGNPTTTVWRTEHYTSETFGGLKGGVGIIVDADAAVDARQLQVRTAQGGWDAEVYASAFDPPDDLAGWGAPVGSVGDASKDETIELALAAPSRYFLLWFTRLAPSTEDDGKFRVEVGDLRLLG